MGLFSDDLIEKEVALSDMDRLAIDLRGLIEDNHKSLIASRLTHGDPAVLSCLNIFISRLDLRYHDKLLLFKNCDDHLKWVKKVKGDYYIVIKVQPLVYHLTPLAFESSGEIIIILDKYLRVSKFKVRRYGDF